MSAIGFAQRIFQDMQANMPYDANKVKRNRPHMRDIAITNAVSLDEDTAIVYIGNEEAEAKAPQYHILNDAKYIHYPYKGTKKSKGSQAFVVEKSKRDYGKWQSRTTQGGTKVYSQEYRSRNYRGKRSNILYTENKQYYENKHFNYIERILDGVLPWIAAEFGGVVMRKTKRSPLSIYAEKGVFEL